MVNCWEPDRDRTPEQLMQHTRDQWELFRGTPELFCILVTRMPDRLREEAVQLAISLESAQRNAEMYLTPIQPGYASSATEKAFSPVSNSPGVISTYDSVRQPTSDTTAAATRIVCYFCGNSKHPRVRCPARNVSCLKCGKKGHFAKVCKTVESAKQCNSTSTDFIAAASHTRDSSNNSTVDPLLRTYVMDPLHHSASHTRDPSGYNVAEPNRRALSTSDLAPAPKELSTHNYSSLPPVTPPDVPSPSDDLPVAHGIEDSKHTPEKQDNLSYNPGVTHQPQDGEPLKPEDNLVLESLRRSSRVRKPVDRLTYY
ncbi:hypothetical protein Pmani_019584 [Petrolisthes manimaculis]|uniref:CCHC-type domain-containing protein n=1 Tax=Petrolisthes manimaculis TaxID=1843537 RepID=A0AAE1U5G3_9EUCA|nr:hypothetical protein Pmani_019584 [Petrolisthes manimaculis]